MTIPLRVCWRPRRTLRRRHWLPDRRQQHGLKNKLTGISIIVLWTTWPLLRCHCNLALSLLLQTSNPFVPQILSCIVFLVPFVLSSQIFDSGRTFWALAFACLFSSFRPIFLFLITCARLSWPTKPQRFNPRSTLLSNRIVSYSTCSVSCPLSTCFWSDHTITHRFLQDSTIAEVRNILNIYVLACRQWYETVSSRVAETRFAEIRVRGWCLPDSPKPVSPKPVSPKLGFRVRVKG